MDKSELGGPREIFLVTLVPDELGVVFPELLLSQELVVEPRFMSDSEELLGDDEFVDAISWFISSVGFVLRLIGSDEELSLEFEFLISIRSPAVITPFPEWAVRNMVPLS